MWHIRVLIRKYQEWIDELCDVGYSLWFGTVLFEQLPDSKTTMLNAMQKEFEHIYKG